MVAKLLGDNAADLDGDGADADEDRYERFCHVAL